MGLIRYFIRKLAELNFYRNDNTLQNQLAATRIFRCLLTASIVSITLYTILVPIDTAIAVMKPSIETYWQLQADHHETLSCSCENIAVPYSSFLSVNPIYHQVVTISRKNSNSPDVFLL